MFHVLSIRTNSWFIWRVHKNIALKIPPTDNTYYLFQVVTSGTPTLRNDGASQISWCLLQCLQWRHIRSLTKTGRGQLTGNSCGPSSHSATLKVLGSCLWNTYCSWDARTVAEVIRRYVSFLWGLVWHFPLSKWRACPGFSVVVRYVPTRSSGKTLLCHTRKGTTTFTSPGTLELHV